MEISCKAITIIIFFFSHITLYAQTGDEINSSLIRYIICNDDTIFIESDSIIEISENDLISFDLGREDSVSLIKSFYLENYNEDWGEWTYQNFISFSNFSESSYIFRIKNKYNLEQAIKLEVSNNKIEWFLILILSNAFLIFLVRRYKRIPIKERFKSYKKLFIKDGLGKSNTHVDVSSVVVRKASVKYDKVTILFADIQGFTKIVEHLNPETLIDELDRFFIRFDEVVEKYKIEKIKTIGDAYMCAGGLPLKNSTNPIEVVLAALEMQQHMKQANIDDNKEVKDFWEVRVGVHTGPVISGTIGRKKLSFDIWGDSVNIASRMESSGVASRINISGVTYELVRDFFVCEYRGKMPIKYKGETDMYFVNKIKPELSVNEQGVIPNEEFTTKLKWIQYLDIEEYILKLLDEKLSPDLHYHSVAHTIDVCTQVEIIGRAESLSDKDLLLVKLAALFHDAGFIKGGDDHEEKSKYMAHETLLAYDFSAEDISKVLELIHVTKWGVEPLGLMGEILKDADLDYLGRADFISISDKLWKEMCVFHSKMSLSEWNKHQLKFLKSHKYYTQTAHNLRQVKKESQIKKITDLLSS